jgi:hypothetical protein
LCRFRDLGSIVSRHSCVKSSKYYIYHKRRQINNRQAEEKSEPCGVYHVEVCGLSCISHGYDPVTVIMMEKRRER